MRDIPYAHLKAEVMVLFALSNGTLPSDGANHLDWPVAQKLLLTCCKDCWEKPTKRPSMQSVVELIETWRDVIDRLNRYNEVLV